MSSHPNNLQHRQPRAAVLTSTALWLSLGGAALVVASLAFYLLGNENDPASNKATAVARRGSMTISIVESGTIQARNPVTVRSAIAGRVAIIELIEEGSIIKEEDVVLPDVQYTEEELAQKTPIVVLDSSQLEDAEVQQDISVQNAHAALIQAQASLEVTINQAESDKEEAELKLELAKLDLEKYAAEDAGEYANALNDAETAITVAKKELEQASDTLGWSEKLAAKGYITKNELRADKLSYDKSVIALKKAENSLKLLQKYTHNRTMKELKNGVTQAERALVRTRTKAEADVVQARATLRASQREYDELKKKYEFTVSQKDKCKIYAPRTGRVVYADADSGSRWHSDEPLTEGSEVYERQALVHISDDKEMKATVKIHESMRTRVRVDMPVQIQSVEFPGVVFTGKVAEIADSPDQQSRWSNRDLRVYRTEIHIDPSNVKLRSGMSCRAEILVAVLEDALSVPLQSLVRLDGQPHVYVIGSNGKETALAVEVGLDNNRRVHVRSGLKEGERVLLNPPLPPDAIGQPPRGNVPELPATQAKPKEQADNPLGNLDREKIMQMTAEQRRKLFEQHTKNMTPEQRKVLLERIQRGRNQHPNNSQSSGR